MRGEVGPDAFPPTRLQAFIVVLRWLGMLVIASFLALHAYNFFQLFVMGRTLAP